MPESLGQGVFTQPGSETEVPFLNCDVRFTAESEHCLVYEYTP